MGRYKIEKRGDAYGDDLYRLFDNGVFLTCFSRSTFQHDLSAYAESISQSSSWVGSILRLFNKSFPAPRSFSRGVPLDDLFALYSDADLVDYLRSKGLRVTRKLRVSDREVVKRLESRGYFVEGLVENCYHLSEGAYADRIITLTSKG